MNCKSIACVFLALASFALATPTPTPTPTTFPLRASDNGRYLVDAADRPFFFHADTPWMLIQKLTLAEAEEYMTDRKARGFTSLQIMMTGFLGMRTREGHLPFDGDHDLTRPNEACFAHADRVIQKAADLGLFLMIAPMWSGCCN